MLKRQHRYSNSNKKRVKTNEQQKKILKTMFTSDTHSCMYLIHDACLQHCSTGLLERASL